MTNEKDQEFKSVDERFEKEFWYRPVYDINCQYLKDLPEEKLIKNFIHSEILADRKIQKEKRDNQVRSRIANFFAQKFDNEPRISEKSERAIIGCFDDENFMECSKLK